MVTYRGQALKPFFEPESVAIIGASRQPGKGGYNILENLLRLGYPGRIYPVNPQAKEILGIPSYPDLKGLPQVPELALIVLPPSRVMPAFEECLRAGIKAVIIESAGFGEMDEAGAALQKRLAEIARRAKVKVMGPNSVGTLNPYFPFDSSLGRLNKLFLPEGTIRKGTVGFIGQTGLFTGVYLPLINEEIGISKIACLGNKCDVDETDMLAYFGADAHTKTIAMYLEDVRRGRHFMELAREITRKKPVIAIKSATTAAGAKASATHTGSLAGDDRVYDAAFRQAGIIRVASFEQLWDVLRGFVHAPLPRGNRLAIINLAGSGCVTAVDACMRYGLTIAELSARTRAEIKKVYPAWWQVRSPVDVWVAIEASGFAPTYTTVTRAVLKDGNVDGVIVIMGAIDWLEGADVPALFKSLKEDFPQKPIFAVAFLGERGIYLKMHRGFQKIGIPCYTSDEAAITTFAAMWRYYRHISGDNSTGMQKASGES